MRSGLKLIREESCPRRKYLFLRNICWFVSLCQGRLAESDAYISAVKAAATGLSAAPRRKSRWLLPLIAAAALLVVLVWLGAQASRLNAPEPAVAVALAANRGVLEAHAPAGRALLLALDLEGLPETPRAFRLEIVNSARERVWQGSAPNGRTARAAVPAMASGVYFVRVLAARGELLREYGLEVGEELNLHFRAGQETPEA